MIDALRLTDDEIVAIAARARSSWQGLLPTVNLDSPEDVVRAAQRGERAIFVAEDVRSWSSGRKTSFSEIITLLTPALGSRPALVAYPVRSANLDEPIGAVICAFATVGGLVIFCATRSSGITEVSVLERDQAEGIIRGVVCSPLEDTSQDAPAVLVVTSPDDMGADVLLVTSEGVHRGRTGIEGVQITERFAEMSAVDAALASIH